MSIVAALQGRQSAKPQGFLITPSDPEARNLAACPPVATNKPAPLVSPSPSTASHAPPPPARMPTPAATPTKRTPTRKAKPTTTPVRSTRSSGKPDHYKPLEGAPTETPSRRKPAPSPSKRQRVVETDSDSDAESVVVRRTPVKRTPTKRSASSSKASATKATKVQLPSPAPEPEQVVADSEDDEVAQAPVDRDAPSESEAERAPTILSPPPRERAQRIAVLPLPSTSTSVTNTPSKARSTPAPRTVTPLKKRTRREAVESDADEAVFGPVASTSTSTPTKGAASTPATTPRRSPSKTVTPSRSSSRIQRLPASVAEIANAPANLRSRLVGFHMEDDGYGAEVLRAQAEEGDSDEGEQVEQEEAVEEDEVEAARRRAEKGKGRALMMEEDEQVDDNEMLTVGEQDDDDLTLPEPPSHFHQGAQAMPSFLLATDSSYPSSPLGTHLASTLALLTGARLPRTFLALDAESTLPPRDVGLLGLPYLEGGFDEWERPLRSALDECVTKGMGNAVMLLGARGVGKTMLVERTLALLSHVHGADSFVTVRLSGLVHTTDRLALRSIAVQLQEQGFGTAGLFADEGDYSSNSATMSTLLRLFEPSSASTATSTGAKASNSSSSKPLVLIVDEFDLFAAHPRQSFLYCLLDIVQGNRRSGGFAVVGVSARVDCLSLLEKRVRSRCQSHVLQVVPRSSFEGLCEMAARMLKADVRAWELVRGEEGAAWARGWNGEVERFLKEKKVVEYLNRLWSIHGNVPTELRSALSHLCYRLDSHSRLYGVGQGGVPRLSFDLLKPPPRTDDKARDDVLKHLSIPQLTALISAKHLSTSTLDRQAGFNFEMVYDGYLSHVRRVAASTATGSLGGGTLRALSKPALREAFDALRARELVLPRASSGSGGGALTAGTGLPVCVPSVGYRAPTQRDPWRMYRLTTWAKDVDREVEARGAECPLALRRWCKNWLD
ncbi:hypothetical protein JCM8208_006236 [Rhodotorula glutinis]